MRLRVSPRIAIVHPHIANLQHRHHWIVNSKPHHSVFPANCRHCGARRDFPVVSPGFDFNDGGPRIEEIWSLHAAGPWPETQQLSYESTWDDERQH
jgi:hypothetical protein